MTKTRLIASYLGSLAARALLAPLKLLPIKKNRVLFVSFRGKQYSCNPRAISEELYRIGRDTEIVWAFHKPGRFMHHQYSEQIDDSYIDKIISDKSPLFLYYALTAHVVVTNTYYKPYLPRRRDQFYLRTWHGGGAYKSVEYPKGLMGKYIRMQQQGADLYLSSSRAFTRQTLRNAFGYTGEVMEQGMPRNDALFNGDWKSIRQNLRRELKLRDKKIALYAPTYREHVSGARLKPDIEMLRAALTRRFRGDWVIMYRGHHVGGGAPAGDMDMSGYEDMQPLLCLADVLITDYSSSIWDMSLTFKPVFLFCPDLKEYRMERDFFTDIHTWPFPLAENDAELYKNIVYFDPDKYANKVRQHHAELGCCETGHASRAAAERIIAECKK